jgi:hypothetical protein
VDEAGKVAKKKWQLFGHVIKTVGDKWYGVVFDNGLMKRMLTLYFVSYCHHGISSTRHAGSNHSNEREEDEMANVGEYIVDQQEHEDIPLLPPEAEDIEAEAKENGGAADDILNAVNGEDREIGVNQPEQDPNATENMIHDPNGKMPGQLPRGADVPRDYASVKRLAKEKVASLIGKTITVTMKRNTYSVTWKVIENHIPDMLWKEKQPARKYG